MPDEEGAVVEAVAALADTGELVADSLQNALLLGQVLQPEQLIWLAYWLVLRIGVAGGVVHRPPTGHEQAQVARLRNILKDSQTPMADRFALLGDLLQDVATQLYWILDQQSETPCDSIKALVERIDREMAAALTAAAKGELPSVQVRVHPPEPPAPEAPAPEPTPAQPVSGWPVYTQKPWQA
jgi:hypothetical protein